MLQSRNVFDDIKNEIPHEKFHVRTIYRRSSMPRISKDKRCYKQIGWLCMFVGLMLVAMAMAGCITTPKKPVTAQPTAERALVKAVNVRSFGNGMFTLVEIMGSKPLGYTAFKLVDPPRIVVDVDAPPADNLTVGPVSDKNVKVIKVEKANGKNKTRLIIGIADSVDYRISGQKGVISVALNPKPPIQQKTTVVAKEENSRKVDEGSAQAHSPRIFFKPKSTDLNQILGVDFTMLDHGKSRLIITTDKRVPFHLERKGQKTLVLSVDNATIPRLLQRHLDSSQFEGAVDRVKAVVSPDRKKVFLNIALREMVPFHVDQTDKSINIEFGPTEIKPPKTKIVPLALAEKSMGDSQAALKGLQAGLKPVAFGDSPPTHKIRKRYTGAHMTMDFVNADVTNILRLIGEVSNLNIVWGPKVKGKVSMRLRNVPWDQALDLVLKNNALAMRREGNVIWVTTRAEMAKIEAEEKKKLEDIEKRKQEQLKRAKELKELEPVVTEYITINYVDVDNVKKVIEETVKSARGKITVDKNTKTIIMTDTASKIKEARGLAKKLDRPTKQVMIEARIVEASTSFSRELGVQWNFQLQHRNDSSMAWRGTPEWALNNTAANYPDGATLYGPTFSTNHPNFSSNLGLVFATLSGNGLTGAFLDTQIALSESEGKLRVLQAPKIVTRDTVTATIQQGTKIVLPSGTDSNGNKTFEMVDASLKLEVTPHITPNNMVIMDVKISDDSPDYANARGESVPINTKSAETTMMVASGDTVVIGGIYKEQKGLRETGQPWLKDIPIIGWLFKNKSWDNEKRELLIFLTPTVLNAG
ncbi:MAG TPA: type IV pilus secretin family protein [Desulfobacterales bacterium]|nr:type IV pilus secretin family protein [Desulfobacterales bacterium]